jgi:hypothetical protein
MISDDELSFDGLESSDDEDFEDSTYIRMYDEDHDDQIKLLHRTVCKDLGMHLTFQTVVLIYSKSQIFEEAIKEWECIALEDSWEKTFCICKHDPIDKQYYMKNKKNGNQLRVGSVCVTKFQQ